MRLLLLVPLLLGAAPAPVVITVTNVRSAEGTIHVALCPEKLFLEQCPIAADAPARAGTVVVTIRGVPPGRYAAQAYHDRNHNGRADRNFVGMPTEDVGFSNNALTSLTKPKFAVAAFDHGAGETRISFRMRSVP